jgi:hypothetical protein
MLRALVSPDDRLRYNVSVYGLPIPLQMDASSLPALLKSIMEPSPEFAQEISDPQLQVGNSRSLAIHFVPQHVPEKARD